MAGFRSLAATVAFLALMADAARAQVGGSWQGPNKEATGKLNRPTGQVECGPAGCRPIPPGCRQVRRGGQWLDANGLSVVCDGKRN
jgi:hypothetical protein